MAYVIIALGFAAGGPPCPHKGQYLESFDFDAHDGVGFGEFTSDRKRAKEFPDFVAAATFWKTVSKARPTRPDRRPNRPLTALSVEIKEG